MEWRLGAPKKLCSTRHRQMFSVRKRSGSNKCFLCESEASATKRSIGTEINHTLW
ncbi:hypothetical protein [Lysinibacillus sp. TE18511]